MLKIVEFADLGIEVAPNVERVESLQYNAASATLVVTTNRAPYASPRHRLYVRTLQEVRYREIVLPEAHRRFAEIVSTPDLPMIFARCIDEGDANYSNVCKLNRIR
jgi:hypothetical protein